MPLAYPGYTWSLTQHADKITKENLYGLLSAAILVRRSPNPQPAANEYLAELARARTITLTTNVRGGRAQPWRDYQQILPELGLMVSTEVVRTPQVTPLGMLYVDGSVGFDELITTQVLRYQYPNGHKTDIAQRLAGALGQRGPRPANRTELDAQSGVLVRPGVLVLRVLRELARSGRPASLSAREIDAALVPVRRNQDWPAALAALRRNAPASGAVLRNSQDWMKLLGKSMLFAFRPGRPDRLSLSAYSLANPDIIDGLLATYESPATFWVPPIAPLATIKLNWFKFFGAPALDDVWIPPTGTAPENYFSRNVIGESGTDEDNGAVAADRRIRLEAFATFVPFADADAALAPLEVQQLLLGRARQLESHTLHDQIVGELGHRLEALGFNVSYDRNSVDLFCEKGQQRAICEVKTFGPRNAPTRLRLGTGQLLEYRWRFERDLHVRPACVLVLGTRQLPAALNYWRDVLHDSAEMGLVGYDNGEFSAITTGGIETALAQ